MVQTHSQSLTHAHAHTIVQVIQVLSLTLSLSLSLSTSANHCRRKLWEGSIGRKQQLKLANSLEVRVPFRLRRVTTACRHVRA